MNILTTTTYMSGWCCYEVWVYCTSRQQIQSLWRSPCSLHAAKS